jgi:hypothetical protein
VAVGQLRGGDERTLRLGVHTREEGGSGVRHGTRRRRRGGGGLAQRTRGSRRSGALAGPGSERQHRPERARGGQRGAAPRCA